MESYGGVVEQAKTNITTTASEASEKLDSFILDYTNSIEPKVIQELAAGKETVKKAKNILVEIKTTLPEVERIIHNTSENLAEGENVLTYLLGEFPYINDKVKELANRIRKINSEASISDIIELLKNDPELERGFFAEPVILNKNELFPIANYGTGMTPFYTVLSLWVGALLLISILSTDIPKQEVVNIRTEYIGRLFTFITIGLLQTIIVTTGDIFLIGVDASSKFWFVIFGLFISAIFISIVYTVVSVFGDVGKAMAIVLLVLQIAASGGTYPVVLLPEFFQMIHPFLPFTYAVDLLREAIGGIIWRRVLLDILSLSVFAIIFLLAGILLKEPVNKQMEKLMKSKDSRLFH